MKKKKLRKSKRPNFKKKPFYSVYHLFRDAEICFKTKGEIRHEFLKAVDGKYQEWLQMETEKGNMEMYLKEIMAKIEKMLGENNKLREQAEKNKMIDKEWAEKKQDEADYKFGIVKFVLDTIGFKQKVNASEFLIPLHKNGK